MIEWSRAETDDGQTFVYLDEGSGPLVVLLHGFPDTPHGYERIAAALVDAGYRAVRPWLRGYHPDTITEGRPYDLVTLSSDPVRLLDALGKRDAVLVGHDWGAMMVSGAATLHPDRVRAIVQIGLPHLTLLPRDLRTRWAARHWIIFNLPWAEWLVRRNDFAHIGKLYERWAPHWRGPDRDRALAAGKAALSDPRALSGALDHYRALSSNVPDELTQPISVPGLVVADTKDVGRDAWEGTVRMLGEGSEAMYVDPPGHWPHRQSEDEFIARLIGFLRDLLP